MKIGLTHWRPRPFLTPVQRYTFSYLYAAGAYDALAGEDAISAITDSRFVWG
ncbi:hypothetical protein [Photobacterium kasasachensis]|uniref:hypothetical protein n=1 Tax=Photobacterium kasasachensis TaxID=2910240 RepID=UPI003D133BAE